MRDSLTILTSGLGISGIEWFYQSNWPEFLKFGGQTVIGLLTIYYIYLKIKKLKSR